MRNENERDRRKKAVPAAFERFTKKENPKTEKRASVRDEKRRRKNAAKEVDQEAPNTEKRTRKPNIKELEGRQYERAGGYVKPQGPKKRERPAFGRRDNDSGERRSFRGASGRFEKRNFGPSRGDRHDGGGSRGEGRFSGEEGRGRSNRGEGRFSGEEGRGRSNRGEGRSSFRPQFKGFERGPELDSEADFFEAAWANRGKSSRKEPKSPLEKRKKAERTLAGDISEPMRLNRFIALSGVCSRREADNMITKGLVTVNGEVVKELGVKVQNGKDDVVVNGKKLSIRQFVYILMNKPKNVITSTDDEMGRKTVMEIVQHYTSVRVFPVGRLDRNTTGLLLFTNDGEMAKKLTHPSHGFEKLYHVKLDKPVSEDHLAQLRIGVELEDGLAQVDDIEYVTGAGRNEVGLKIHIGKNRIVRRMFEHLGYEVVMLDRTQLGPLHKQGLKRGTCRPLTEAEIGFLKMVQ